MEPFYQRTAMLIGVQGVEKLKQSRVAVFGVGGVGGQAVLALARAGVGGISVFDDDVVSPSNLNRQAVAWRSTLGMAKVSVAAAMVADINPDCKVETHKVFFLPENAADYNFSCYDYIVDAVDTVSAKLVIIAKAKAEGVPVISAMGAGNKLHPELLTVADISQTSVCPLARIMRRECKKRGLTDVKVVYSTEEPQALQASAPQAEESTPLRAGKPKENTPGSISFVPAAAGLILAGAVVRDLI